MSKSQNKVARTAKRSSNLLAVNTRKVSAPLSKGNVVRGHKPTIRQNGRKVVIIHREYVEDINSTTAFGVYSFYLNPGLSDLFPWLSNVALNYESYRFKKLAFTLETELSANTNGYVACGIDYDSVDPIPVSKQQLMNNQTSARAPCWEGLKMECSNAELNKLGPEKFVRYDAVASTDLKTYDSGRLFVAIVTPDGAIDSAGELYVEYEVELFTPQLRPNEAAYVRSRGWHTDTATKAAPWTGAVVTGRELANMITGVAESVGIMFRNMSTFLYTLQTIGTGESAYVPTGVNSVVTQMPGSISSGGIKRQVSYMVETLADNLKDARTDGFTGGTAANIAISLAAWTTVSSMYAVVSRFRSVARSDSFTDHVVYTDKANNFEFRYRALEPLSPLAAMELEELRRRANFTPQ